MGRCHEFGTQIRQGCQHPMRPGTTSCGCRECGVVCGGQFDGCPDVWARGSASVAVKLRSGAGASPDRTAAPGPVTAQASDRWETRALFAPAGTGVSPTGDDRNNGGRATEARPPVPSGDPDYELEEEAPDASSFRRIAEASSALSARLAAQPPPEPERPPPAAGVPPAPPLARESAEVPAPELEEISAVEGPPSTETDGRPENARPTGPVPVQAAPNARVQLFRWFETEFSLLRNELHELVGTVTEQQAMVAELLEDRHGQLRLALLAESLPETVEDSVRTSVAEHMTEVTEETQTLARELRQSVDKAEATAADRRQDTELLDSAMGSLRDTVLSLEATVRSQSEDLAQELPKLKALRTGISRQLRPVIEAVPASVSAAVTAAVTEALAAHQQAVESRVNEVMAEVQALKVSVSRQLKPLTAAVERTVDRAAGEAKPVRSPRRRP